MPTIKPTPFYRAVGDAIRVSRNHIGLRQVELAARVGVVPSGISQIESGQRRPPVELVSRIAIALGVEVSALVPAHPIEEHTPV